MTETTWIDIFTRYVIPPLLGGAGGLVSIYGQWGIEKRRKRLEARRELVGRWRTHIIPSLIRHPETRSGGQQSKYQFMELSSYASLRPHLKKDLLEKLEGPTIYIAAEGAPPFPRNEIIDEISRIEREWQLI